MDYHRTNYKIINPKSITMTQLYGLFDPYTHEWSDGVLGGTFREMATATTEERKVNNLLKHTSCIHDTNTIIAVEYDVILYFLFLSGLCLTAQWILTG